MWGDVVSQGGLSLDKNTEELCYKEDRVKLGGISEEARTHIFERFYREEKSHSREKEGFGLGLSIAGRILERHKGRGRVGSDGASDSDGKMKTGKRTSVYDGDDERGTYYFGSSGESKGCGFTGTMDGYLYYNGILVEAEDDSDYQVFKVNDTYYLVSEAGKVQTTSKSCKSDGAYAYKIENGTIYTIDSD